MYVIVTQPVRTAFITTPDETTKTLPKPTGPQNEHSQACQNNLSVVTATAFMNWVRCFFNGGGSLGAGENDSGWLG